MTTRKPYIASPTKLLQDEKDAQTRHIEADNWDQRTAETWAIEAIKANAEGKLNATELEDQLLAVTFLATGRYPAAFQLAKTFKNDQVPQIVWNHLVRRLGLI